MNEFIEITIWTVGVVCGLVIESYAWYHSKGILSLGFGLLGATAVVAIALLAYFAVDSYISLKKDGNK